MLFSVSQISPQVELVFENTDRFINVYPSYHQNGDLIYANVNPVDWNVLGGTYQWENSYAGITDTTVPVIQLIYSYNATAAEKQAQYLAFKTIRFVETVSGRLYLRADSRPDTSFRIRYRRLDRMDLAIPLNRNFAIGIGSQLNPDSVSMYLTALNPVTNQNISLMTTLNAAEVGKAGVMTSDMLSRLLKLEKIYDDSMNYPYQITGYNSAESTSTTSTGYSDIAALQAIAPNTWYKECAIATKSNITEFTTAVHLFYQQQATLVDVTHVYTGNVTTMGYALAANVLLKEIKGLELLDTHNVTDIGYMFSDNAALTHIDLSKLNFRKVMQVEGLFKGCTSLEYLDVRSIDFSRLDSNGNPLINQPDVFTGVPDSCEIWVGGQEQAAIISSIYPNLTNITYN